MIVARVQPVLRICAALCVGMVITAALVMFQSHEFQEVDIPFSIPDPIPAHDIGKNAHKNVYAGSTKYFIEPGGSYNLMHYDLRFYKKELEAKEHRLVLEDLVRSYLNVTNYYEVETWLAHGTLMGWWWGSKILPWDADLDVQVSHETMHHLASSLNFTEFRYRFSRPNGKVMSKTYLLDINPYYADTDLGDGMNIIDGRWIDTDNGLYVDITAVSERSKSGDWGCKDGHRYAQGELWPLMETDFEGIRALVPAKATALLRAEYGTDSTSKEKFKGYHWDVSDKTWVKNKNT